MGKRNDFLPAKPGFQRRPRIDSLLKRGIDCPFTTVVGAPGYGKTIAVSAFVERLPYPLVWISLSAMDNEISYFWHTVTAAMRRELPEIANDLEKTSFPDTMSKFVNYTNQVSEIIQKHEKIIIVIDNYEVITNEQILLYLNRCIKIDNYSNRGSLHHIIISNEKLEYLHNPFHESFRNVGEYNRITSSELAFTREEIRNLFAFHGKLLSEDELDEICDRSGGWPIMLYLLCTNHDRNNTLEIITDMFENQFYNSYSPEAQLLLVKLSLLPRFSLDIVKEIIAEDYADSAHELYRNIFVHYDFTTQQFHFQSMYKEFLFAKKSLIEREEITHILNIGGRWFLEKGLYHEARDLFFEAQNYEQFMLCLSYLSSLYRGVSYTQMLQKLLKQIPDEYRQTNPWVDFHLAYTYINAGQFHKAKTYFLNIFKIAEHSKTDYTLLIGEVYRMLTDITLLQNETNGLEYAKKAAALLPNGSFMLSEQTFAIEENGIFFLPEDGSKTVSEMVAYVYELTSYRERICNGCLSGYEHLFEAEAMLGIGDFEQAKNAAMQAVLKAAMHKQHDIVINGYYILTRVALCQADYKAASQALRQGNKYIKETGSAVFSELIDIFNARFYIQVGSQSEIAAWIKETDFSVYAEKPLWEGRNIFICSFYLLHQGDYAKALSVLSRLDSILQQRGLWNIRLYTELIKAIVYEHQNNTALAMEAFQNAYRMVYDNAIFYPLAELGTLLLPVIKLARKSSEHSFDSEWLFSVEEKLRHYEENLEKIKKAYQEDKGSKRTHIVHLTERELHVVTLLSQGMTREEIAREMDISVNGVKKFLSNIYLKLGAKNRADAITIALQNQIIQ